LLVSSSRNLADSPDRRDAAVIISTDSLSFSVTMCTSEYRIRSARKVSWPRQPESQGECSQRVSLVELTFNVQADPRAPSPVGSS